MSAPAAQQWAELAIAAERAGDMDRATALFEQGLAAFPQEPRLANSAANLAMRAGDTQAAERLFARAQELAPDELEFALNRAIALSKLERHHEALAVLIPHEDQGRTLARYCSARGAAERGAGNRDQAAFWYDMCIALDPQHARGLHGRARIAIERGEASARQRFERALGVNPADPDLWLGRAQALEVEGEAEAARAIATSLVAQAPHWLEGLKFLAQLRLAAQEEGFDDHYAEAARRLPDDPNIPAAHIAVLAGHDRNVEAAMVAAAARRRFPGEPHFALLEAIHAGAAGEDERAEELFAGLDLATADRKLHEARHWIRRGDPARADALLRSAIAKTPWSIEAWALRGVSWRLLDDPRGDWLHAQEGLVTLLPLAESEAGGQVTDILHELHDRSAFPLGQSLRGGTQTRGNLFDRLEPELRALHQAITRTLDIYRCGLPPPDERHPLLRHRDAPWRLQGSWSVRLLGGGDFHTSHIHPQGIVSSALYLEVPPAEGAEKHEGWLEVGRPAPDLRTTLEPLAVLQPRPGHLALFPSTLYHGTRPFSAGRRMTIAFDVVPRDSPQP